MSDGKQGGPAHDWQPTPEITERSRLLTVLREWGYSPDLDGYREMNARAVAEPEWFWRAAVEDLDIEFTKPFDAVLDESAGKPFPKWFVGGEINVAHLASHRHAAGPLADKTAVIYEGDSGQRRTLTFAELDRGVRDFAAQLAALGVQRGDRVVLFMPVVPEAAVAFLAIAMLGAVAVPTFSGYAADALSTRIQDAQARVVITADGTTRRGKTVPMKVVADDAVALSPAVEHVIVIRHLGDSVPMTDGRDVYFDELPTGLSAVETAATGANDPLCLVYTSGTTGRPKGIVHSHGGFAVKTALDFAYGFDVDSTDVVSWITDLGWLVGPMLITGPLQLGATIVMVEGLPVHPTPARLWDVAARNGVTVQGIAPTAARAIRAAGPDGVAQISTLRSFVSTGEAWDDPTWWWLFTEIGQRRTPILNFSGGTEVGGGLITSFPALPASAAAFTGPLPGIAVAVLDDAGNPVVDQIGELAVLNTFPGMTHSFWGDDKRYFATYWDRFDDVWIHGDLASVDQFGEWRIHGRSDDTLKLSGRRVGPAEIEAALLKDRRITEVAVIGVPDEARGMRAVAFVVTGDDDADPADVQNEATVNAGKGFAPTVVVVEGLPKTKNGKIMRRLIRSRYLGQPTGDLSALDPGTPIDNIPTQPAGE